MGVLKLLAITIVSATLALALQIAAAANLTVDNGGPCSDVTGSPAFCTIQGAIDAAAPGDTIKVKNGTYAGATVDKAVHLKGQGKVVVDTGPFSHPGALRAGFLFDPDRSGSGATIEGFDLVGTMQTSFVDDGKLDFAVFSRGADDVIVAHNSMTDVLQGVTDWNGSGWTIDHNSIEDLWTLCGGGIGVLVGGFDGLTVVDDTVVSHNDVGGVVHVSPGDCGGYDATGIVIFADFRGRPGAPSVESNTVEHNKVDLVSDAPAVVNANGIELTVAYSVPPVVIPETIKGNEVAHNQVKGVSGDGIVVSEGSGGNTIDKNDFTNSGGTDAIDESTGVGTAGTANTWTGNHCDTSSPPGLCK